MDADSRLPGALDAPPTAGSHPELPVDSDVSMPVTGRQGVVVAAVAGGGMVGALARYQLGRSWPARPDGFPWGTLTINVVGCLLIGVLMVLVTERGQAHPLIRPFLGTGVLGGFTTFSTYTVDIHRLLTTGHLALAMGYLLATAVSAVAAAGVGIGLTRRLVDRPE
jgi:CrcB protein